MSAYSGLVLAEPSLVAYWRLGDSPGSGVAVAASGGIDGTATGVTFGAPGLAEGDADTCASFDGSTSVIDLGDNFDFAGTSTYSVEAIIKVAVSSATQTIACKLDAPTTNREGWSLQWQDAGAGGDALFVRSVANASLSATTTLQQVRLDKRQHLLGTYDGANLNLYVNGILKSGPVADARVRNVTTTHAAIGARLANSTIFFNGLIDEVSLYNAALNQDQVSAHYGAAFRIGVSPREFPARHFGPF